MNRKFLFYTILICLIILLFLSCPTVPPEEDDWDTFTGYTVSGTLTRADANGKTAYLKLVAHGEFYTSDALYLDSSTQFVIGSATYSKGGVSAGNYTGWIFIDMNGNANPSDPLPDTGDYYVENENINITSDTVINVLEGDWDTFTG
ncbi:MAG: hypothetical protein JXB50_02810, partial [Spirochaetes bacterium]|nr:hypothetical protein [Spirochaetota bacterium]